VTTASRLRKSVNLRSRIAIIASLAVALAVVLVSAGAYYVTRDELLDQVDDSLLEVAAQADDTRGLITLLSQQSGARGPFRTASRFEVLYLQVFDTSGFVVHPENQEFGLPLEEADLELAVFPAAPLLRDIEIEGGNYRMVTRHVGDGVAFQAARSLGEVEATLAGLTVVLVIAGALGVALAAALGLVVSRSALRPIAALTNAAERVAETQELAERIVVDRDDEVGRLAIAFNTMLAALEESRSQQRRLVRDAGHELRTPLTALRTNIELLVRADDLPSDTRRRLLEDVTFELEQLSKLVSEVVDLASATGASDEVGETVQLDELAAAVAHRFERRTQHPIVVESEPTDVRGQPDRIERAISNLVDNAVKWSPPDQPVEVVVGSGRVSVVDHGPGIDEIDRARIFDRFYRADTARTTPGSGLGLAIVQQIVEEHDGNVFVEAGQDGGAVVGFELPEV
jgi:two-component system sensor histidine kinase MprB